MGEAWFITIFRIKTGMYGLSTSIILKITTPLQFTREHKHKEF
jgi:hypothetical protein